MAPRKRDRQSGGTKTPAVVHPGAALDPTRSGRATGTSHYNELAGPQPPNTIRDVDAGNWFSPFQPIMPFGPPAVRYPRLWDYRTGINLDYAPAQFAKFEQLQAMSRSWGILRTIIETRKDQLMRMPRAFQVRGAPNKKSKWIDKLNEFFRKPDGKNTYTRWKRMLLEDLFVIDAPTIYKWRALDGSPLSLTVMNGATVKPLIDDVGRRPDYPDPAFQQIIKGLPMTNFDERELIYAPMRPTPQMPIYGYSPVEQIYVEVLVGIKRLLYQSSFWTEGSMPELIVTVPETWTPQQTAQFQAHFDALMSGNLDMKSKVRFMPGGMKPFDIKNANGDGLKGEVDEWWARLICFAFSIPPTPFVRQMNRATAETAQATAEEEGLHPLMTWDKEEIMDPIIQDDFGFDEIEFNYLPDPEVDQSKQQVILSGYVKEGIMKRNEAREQLGMEAADGGDELTVDTASGPVPLKESIEAARQKALAAPDELGRAQESHDVSIESQKAQAKKPPVKKVAGVSEHAETPFSKLAEDPIDRQDPTIRKTQRELEDAVEAIFRTIGPVIGKRVSSAVADAVAGSVGTGENIQVPSGIAERIADDVANSVSLAEFETLVEPTQGAIADVARRAGTREASRVRLAVGEDYQHLVEMVHQDALDYARERAAEMVGMKWDEGLLVPNPDARWVITDTTRDKIRELVVKKLGPPEGDEAFDLNGALEELTDELTDGPIFSSTRAALIAQAELGNAHSEGTLASLQRTAELGFTVLKQWTTAMDDRVCVELCIVNELTGPIPLHSLFPSGDYAPLAHPRCRCALVGIVQDQPAAKAA